MAIFALAKNTNSSNQIRTMNLQRVYIKADSKFSKSISDWAERLGIETAEYDFKSGEDQKADGLLLINANQDVDKEIDAIHSYFDSRHIPTQKVDVNGTLQVAVNSFKMWVTKNKCREILILGSEKLLENENYERFLNRIESEFTA